MRQSKVRNLPRVLGPNRSGCLLWVKQDPVEDLEGPRGSLHTPQPITMTYAVAEAAGRDAAGHSHRAGHHLACSWHSYPRGRGLTCSPASDQLWGSRPQVEAWRPPHTPQVLEEGMETSGEPWISYSLTQGPVSTH